MDYSVFHPKIYVHKPKTEEEGRGLGRRNTATGFITSFSLDLFLQKILYSIHKELSPKKYKQTGFVWQDLLLDRDLVTPISDNEYILKGTQISNTPIYDDVSSYEEKDVLKHKKLPLLQSKAKDHKISSKQSTNQENSSEIEEELPPFSIKPFIVAHSSIKPNKDTNLVASVQHGDEHEKLIENSCFFNSRFLYKSKNEKNGIDFDKSTMNSSTWSSTPSYSSRSKSDSFGSSNMLHNIVTHRVVNKNNFVIEPQGKIYKNIVTDKRSGLSSLVGLFIPRQIVS